MKIYRDRVEVGKSFSAPATATFCWHQSRESFSVWWADNDTIMCSYTSLARATTARRGGCCSRL